VWPRRKKRLYYWRTIEPTLLVVPPELLLRIEACYAKKIRGGVVSHRVTKPVFDRYMHEPALCDRVHAISRELYDVVFNPDSGEWVRGTQRFKTLRATSE
jgi:hypothetical protein